MTKENQAAQLFSEMAANAEKLVKAAQLFGQTKDEDVAIGTTPKHLVMRRDKVELFRYKPTVEATATRIASAQRTARAGPSNVARNPSPSVLTSLPRNLASSRRT